MTLLNDLVTRLMLAGIPLAGALANRALHRRIRRFPREQAALRARYGIRSDTPIRGYDDHTRQVVRALAAHDPDVRIATTSGSTGAPKELAYTRERLQQYKRDSAAVGLQAYARHRVRRPGLFILASLKTDDSFASLVLHGRRTPWLAGLIEPSRYLADPILTSLTAELGANAVRLWLMLLSNPGVLYATNPSTIAAFFTDVHEHWSACTALVRRAVSGDLLQHDALRRIERRVGASGARQRLAAVAASSSPLSVAQMLPGLSAWVAWDGGYTTSFLPVVHRFLPPERFAHVPMYSMSTETIETLTWFDAHGDVHFLPLGPGVLYEFLPEGADDRPELLVDAAALLPGQTVSMVVSDPWGLVRYQTDDLFEVRAVVEGLPDLRFLRRRGVAHSFTGEKLTGEQLSLAFAELRNTFASLSPGVELVVLPSHPAAQDVPHYVLVLAPTASTPLAVEPLAVAHALDAALGRLNRELADKMHSGRLGPTRAVVVAYEDLAKALDRRTTDESDVQQRAWESQFKLAPLLGKRWEDVAAALEASGDLAR